MADGKWMEQYIDLRFPLWKKDLKEDLALEILKEHRPNFLYKYCRPNTHSQDYITSGEVWQPRMFLLNDPYESLFGYDKKRIRDDLSKFLKEKYKAPSKKQLEDYIQKHAYSAEVKANIMRENLQECFVSCSFAGNQSSPVMWAHYSADHQGLCLQYDTKKLPEVVLENQLHPVAYQDKPADFTDIIFAFLIDNNPLELNPNFMKRVMFTKSVLWQYENEWRLVKGIIDKSENQAIKGKKFQIGQPNKVYFGYRFGKNPPDVKKKFLAICESLKLIIYIMSPKLDDFIMEAEPVSIAVAKKRWWL